MSEGIYNRKNDRKEIEIGGIKMLKVGGIYQERHYDTLYFVVIEDADLHMFSYDLYIKSDTMTRDVVCQVLHAQDGFSDFSYDTKRYIALRADGYLGQMEERHVDLLQHVFHLMKGN